MGVRAMVAQYAAWGVVALCVGWAVARALGSTPPPVELNPSEAAARVQTLAKLEGGRRMSAAREFPGDHWSQDDDFHHQEEHWIRDQFASSGLTPGQLLHAIDADLRAHFPNPMRKATASPCKPRPVYE
jgi:hypothetical protein